MMSPHNIDPARRNPEALPEMSFLNNRMIQNPNSPIEGTPLVAPAMDVTGSLSPPARFARQSTEEILPPEMCYPPNQMEMEEKLLQHAIPPNLLLVRQTCDMQSGNWNVLLQLDDCTCRDTWSLKVQCVAPPLSAFCPNPHVTWRDVEEVATKQLIIAERKRHALPGPGRSVIGISVLGSGRISLKLPITFSAVNHSLTLWKNTQCNISAVTGGLLISMLSSPVSERLSGELSKYWYITVTLEPVRHGSLLQTEKCLFTSSRRESVFGLTATPVNPSSSLTTFTVGLNTASSYGCWTDTRSHVRSRVPSFPPFGSPLLSPPTSPQRNGTPPDSPPLFSED